MKTCQKFSSIVISHDPEFKETLLFRARCKQWNCEYCAGVNRRIWQARIMLELQTRPSPNSWHFLTVTLPGHLHGNGTAASLAAWRERWSVFYDAFRYEYRKPRYIRVFEVHVSGTLHVHMLTDAYINDSVQGWYYDKKRKERRDYWRSATIERMAVAAGLGWRHDARPLKPSYNTDRPELLVGSYVAKYLTKGKQSAVRSAIDAAGMGRVRMIQASRGWYNDTKKAESSARSWALTEGVTIDEFATWGMGDGPVDYVDLDLGRRITSDDFLDTDIYPPRPDPAD